MSSDFAGFSPAALTFFRQLARNNDRDWFNARKPIFEREIRAPMLELVSAVNARLRAVAPDYASDDPTRAIYRIYRDTRFSKDKTPYKTHIAANFPHRRLTRHAAGGFYFQVSHEGVGVAGGVYMPGPDELSAIRRHMSENWPRLERLLADRALRRLAGALRGDSLKRSPRGFDPAHPAASLLRMKNWYFWVELPPRSASSRHLVGDLLRRMQAMRPVIDFINEPLLAALARDDESARPRRPDPMW